MPPSENTNLSFDYSVQDSMGATCTAQAWAKVPPHLDNTEKVALIARIKQLLLEKDATLVAHYYVDSDIQDLSLIHI